MTDGWLAWPAALRRAAQTLIDLALAEDLGGGDVTARYFGGDEARYEARLIAREPGVLAGLPLFMKTFQSAATRLAGEPSDADAALDSGDIEREEEREDGARFDAGDCLARFSAPAPVLHGAERSGLNFIQRLSGVATATSAAVAASSGPAVYDTRKTTPGFRLLEKYAVRMGGGVNHRIGLFDAALVKDNHKDSLGGIGAVMERVLALPAGLPLIIEVDNLAELAQVLDHPAVGRVTRILLDNFPKDAVARALDLRDARGGGPPFEISGRLRPTDLADPAYARVEAASLGAITHSARALDLALEIAPA